ncbi:MAG: DUF58 domain-containing protein [Acidobacteriaceae bacterium]|jgi:uncharacterized protein (DUF58 family)|nr:DUF58 domain-containing protein [Acidobacteriaceae bacterium]
MRRFWPQPLSAPAAGPAAALLRWVRALPEAIRPRIALRITRAGLWFTITILLTGIGAFLSANNLIFLILSALLATLVVSGNLNRLTLAGLEVEFEPPEHLFAKEDASGRFLIRNTKSWFPSFALRLTSANENGLRTAVFIPLIAPGEIVAFHADVCFARRGRYRENGFAFSSRFPFGFAERRARVTLLAEVLVYPELRDHHLIHPLFADVLAEAEARRQGRGAEFHQLRPYRYEDDARHIDWRATARHGEMHLREYAIEQQEDVELWLDLGGWQRQPFEDAISALATQSLDLHRRGIGLRFRSQDCDLTIPVQNTVYGLLQYLALAEPEPLARPFPPASVPPAVPLLLYAATRDRAPAALSSRTLTAAAAAPTT